MRIGTIIIENGFINPTNLTTLFLSVVLVDGQIYAGKIVLNSEDFIRVLSHEFSMEREGAKGLYSLTVIAQDAENVRIGTFRDYLNKELAIESDTQGYNPIDLN